MKRIRTTMLAMLLFFSIATGAAADWVMCQPDSWVNVRNAPGKNGTVIGRLELGDEVETDGIRKKGYLHVTGLSMEDSEGWIHAGFLTDTKVKTYRLDTQIRSRGRVACRRSIGGTRRKWLRDGMKVTVYAWSADWAITNQGFIKTDYLGGL